MVTKSLFELTNRLRFILKIPGEKSKALCINCVKGSLVRSVCNTILVRVQGELPRIWNIAVIFYMLGSWFEGRAPLCALRLVTSLFFLVIQMVCSKG